MMLPKNCIATKALLLVSAFVAGGSAWAGTTVGTVTDLAGALLAKKADGTVKILSLKSVVEQGDTLVTEKDTYARIKFIDSGEIVLKPNSQFRIDKFAYDVAKKEDDSAVFSLIKGGLRSVTGLVGKRSQDRFGVSTPVATIGIRGTTFIVEYVPPDTAAVAAYAMSALASAGSAYAMPASAVDRVTMGDIPLHSLPPVAPIQLAQLATPASGTPEKPADKTLPPGLHVQVTEGLISVTNGAGSKDVGAGQFGYVASFMTVPVIVPTNPGIRFTPPLTFSGTTSVLVPNNTAPDNLNQNPECEVR